MNQTSKCDTDKMSSVVTDSLEASPGSALTTVDDLSPFLISDEIQFYLLILMAITLHGAISLLGVTTNLINMIVFKRQGLKDSMSVGFFSLSLSDFIVCVLNLAVCVCYTGKIVSRDDVVNFDVIIEICFSWTKYIAYLSSCWITMMMSLERCVCVTFPFQVKSLFTRTRCVIAVASIFAVNISLHVPIYTSQRIVWNQVTSSLETGNLTGTKMAMEIEYSLKWSTYLELVDTANVSLSLLCQTFIILSAIWMINALKSSTSIRSNITRPDITKRGVGETPGKQENSNLTSTKMEARQEQQQQQQHSSGRISSKMGTRQQQYSSGVISSKMETRQQQHNSGRISLKMETRQQQHSSGRISSKIGANLSDRERKLIKLVAFMAIYQALCNVPHFVSITVFQVWLKFHRDGHTHNFETTLWRLGELFHVTCVSLNFVVYFRFNGSYRKRLKVIFGCL